MDPGIQTSVTEFILSEVTEQPQIQLSLFLLFWGIYVVMVVGNLYIITLMGLSYHLHTPMYYFLSNLSSLTSVSPLSLPPKCW